MNKKYLPITKGALGVSLFSKKSIDTGIIKIDSENIIDLTLSKEGINNYNFASYLSKAQRIYDLATNAIHAIKASKAKLSKLQLEFDEGKSYLCKIGISAKFIKDYFCALCADDRNEVIKSLKEPRLIAYKKPDRSGHSICTSHAVEINSTKIERQGAIKDAIKGINLYVPKDIFKSLVFDDYKNDSYFHIPEKLFPSLRVYFNKLKEGCSAKNIVSGLPIPIKSSDMLTNTTYNLLAFIKIYIPFNYAKKSYTVSTKKFLVQVVPQAIEKHKKHIKIRYSKYAIWYQLKEQILQELNRLFEECGLDPILKNIFIENEKTTFYFK